MGIDCRKFVITASALFAVMTGEQTLGGSVDKFIGTPVKTLSGPTFDWSKVNGKVLLIVNIATRCGYTPQLKSLQKLHNDFQKQGLEVIGIPSNDFGGQTPESAAEVGKICALNFGVNFPLTEKMVVKGPGKHPLISNLLMASPQKSEIAWNFEKFLVDRRGSIVARFPSEMEPNSAELIKKINLLLKE